MIPHFLHRVPTFVWTFIAVAQSVFWFVGIPYLLKPVWEEFWNGVTERWGEFATEILLNMGNLVLYFVYGLAMIPIYRMKDPFFERYKISTKEWPWFSDKPEVHARFRALSLKSARLIVVNFFILVPLMSAAKVYMQGITVSFKTDEWPTMAESAFHLLVMVYANEFGFYWSHRMLHLPSMYRFHKVHHEYKDNNVLASTHNHPVDYIVSIVGPALLAISITNPHSINLLQFFIYAIWTNLDDHCGYAFPWSPVRWFPLANLTEHHEFHHVVNMGCFASKVNVWDRMFGTDQIYVKWAAKRDAKNSESKKVQ